MQKQPVILCGHVVLMVLGRVLIAATLSMQLRLALLLLHLLDIFIEMDKKFAVLVMLVS